MREKLAIGTRVRRNSCITSYIKNHRVSESLSLRDSLLFERKYCERNPWYSYTMEDPRDPGGLEDALSLSLLTLSRELVALIVESLDSRDILALDTTCRSFWKVIRALPNTLRRERVPIACRVLALLPNVRSVGVPILVSSCSELEELEKRDFDSSCLLSILWSRCNTTEEENLALLRVLHRWGRMGVPMKICTMDGVLVKEVHSYSPSSDSLFVTAVYENNTKNLREVLHGLTFSSLALVLDYVYPVGEENGEEYKILSKFLGSTLNIDNLRITTLVIQEPWPYLVDPKLFPHLQTLDFHDHHPRVFLEPHHGVRTIIRAGLKCYFYNFIPESTMEDLKENLQYFMSDFPNLQEAHLTLYFRSPNRDIHSVSKYISSLLPQIQGLHTIYPQLHITTSLKTKSTRSHIDRQ